MINLERILLEIEVNDELTPEEILELNEDKQNLQQNMHNSYIGRSIIAANNSIMHLTNKFKSTGLDLQSLKNINENRILKHNLEEFLNFLKKSAEESNCDLEFEGDEYDEEYEEDIYVEGDDEEDEFDGPVIRDRYK